MGCSVYFKTMIPVYMVLTFQFRRSLPIKTILCNDRSSMDISLLKYEANLKDMDHIFVLPSYLAVLWENGQYNTWFYRHVIPLFFISSMIKLIIIISTYLFSFYIYIMLFLIYRCSSVVSSGYFYLLTKMGTIGSCWWQTLQQGKSKFLTPWGART